MPVKKKVQDTHNSSALKSLHLSMVSLASVMNRPRNDERLIQEAGVTLDQALFRLLVVIERVGPIGVVDLADRLGRDCMLIELNPEYAEMAKRRINSDGGMFTSCEVISGPLFADCAGEAA